MDIDVIIKNMCDEHFFINIQKRFNHRLADPLDIKHRGVAMKVNHNSSVRKGVKSFSRYTYLPSSTLIPSIHGDSQKKVNGEDSVADRGTTSGLYRGMSSDKSNEMTPFRYKLIKNIITNSVLKNANRSIITVSSESMDDSDGEKPTVSPNHLNQSDIENELENSVHTIIITPDREMEDKDQRHSSFKKRKRVSQLKSIKLHKTPTLSDREKMQLMSKNIKKPVKKLEKIAKPIMKPKSVLENASIEQCLSYIENKISAASKMIIKRPCTNKGTSAFRSLSPKPLSDFDNAGYHKTTTAFLLKTGKVRAKYPSIVKIMSLDRGFSRCNFTSVSSDAKIRAGKLIKYSKIFDLKRKKKDVKDMYFKQSPRLKCDSGNLI